MTSLMIERGFKDGKNVFLPRIVPLASSAAKQHPTQTSELKMMQVKSMDQINSLKPHGKYKLREPEDGPDCK